MEWFHNETQELQVNKIQIGRETNQNKVTPLTDKNEDQVFRSRSATAMAWPNISDISDFSNIETFFSQWTNEETKLEPYKKMKKSIKPKKLPKARKTVAHTTVSTTTTTEKVVTTGALLRQGDENLSSFMAHNLQEYFERAASEITDYDMNVVVLNRTVEYNDIVLLKLTAKEGVEIVEDKKEEEEVKSEENNNEEDVEKIVEEKHKPLNDKFEDQPPEKKIVLIVHGLNSIGFIGNLPLINPKYFKILLSIYKQLLKEYDVFLIPMANPDGVVAQSRSVLWNKNNSPQSACNGVAIDRNFDISWEASNFSSCSPLYPGPHAFSELESRAIHEVMEQYQVRLHAFFHVHSATVDQRVTRGEALLYPFGFTDVIGESEDKFLELKSEIDDLMTERFKHLKFHCDSIHNYYKGPVHGSSVDYAYKVFGIPHAFEVLIQTYPDPQLVVAALNSVWKPVFKIVLESLSKRDVNEY